MKAFVTGSTGLLGNNLVRLLVEHGHEVKALVRSRRKAAQVFGDLPVTLVEGDLLDVAGFAHELAGCDVLFHTAAYFREYYQPGDHWPTLKAINVDATLALLESAERHGVKRAVLVSTSGVIGHHRSGGPSDETTPGAPSHTNLYFRSKVLADALIAQFVQHHTLDVVTIMPGWMFGPHDYAPTSSGQLVLDFLQRKLPAIAPGGGTIVDARDVALALIRAAQHGVPGERYAVAGRLTTLAELMQTLEQVSGIRGPRVRLPYSILLLYAFVVQTVSRFTKRPVLVTVEAVRTMHNPIDISSARAVRELGITFRPLTETLSDEVAWIRQQHGSHEHRSGLKTSEAV